MITPRQCKMARAALGWSVLELAKRAKVSGATVNRFEVGRARPVPATLQVIRHAFEAAGVQFMDDQGVRIPAPTVQ
jgi:transcriptional regulator with XRE-family HTH domain